MNTIDKIVADDLDHVPDQQPAKQPARPLKVTGRLAVALNLMTWRGLARDEAAIAAGLRPHSLYCALRKSHVKAHYLAECETLRLSGRARRLHRLAEIAEQSTNLNAAVAACKTAETLNDPATNISISVGISAGWIIDLGERPQQQAQAGVSHGHTIEKTPAQLAGSRIIEHDAG
jgi:hypothetical protein